MPSMLCRSFSHSLTRRFLQEAPSQTTKGTGLEMNRPPSKLTLTKTSFKGNRIWTPNILKNTNAQPVGKNWPLGLSCPNTEKLVALRSQRRMGNAGPGTRTCGSGLFYSARKIDSGFEGTNKSMNLQEQDEVATICGLCGRSFSSEQERSEHERCEHPPGTSEIAVQYSSMKHFAAFIHSFMEAV